MLSIVCFDDDDSLLHFWKHEFKLSFILKQIIGRSGGELCFDAYLELYQINKEEEKKNSETLFENLCHPDVTLAIDSQKIPKMKVQVGARNFGCSSHLRMSRNRIM